MIRTIFPFRQTAMGTPIRRCLSAALATASRSARRVSRSVCFKVFMDSWIGGQCGGRGLRRGSQVRRPSRQEQSKDAAPNPHFSYPECICHVRKVICEQALVGAALFARFRAMRRFARRCWPAAPNFTPFACKAPPSGCRVGSLPRAFGEPSLTRKPSARRGRGRRHRPSDTRRKDGRGSGARLP